MKSKSSGKPIQTGVDLLHHPALNKGTAFTQAEREALGLRGLLPPRPCSQDDQVKRVLENFRQKPDELEQYIFMTALQDRNETLFYRVIIDHPEEMMPIIYTPTVGRACQQYGHIYRRARGLFISANDRGEVRKLLQNWPKRDVRVIVVTDGERILGLGDLGANGMGIPVGKLALYTACAGVHPSYCLPVTLDVGTNNETLLSDPLYLGIGDHRLRGTEYDELIDEFIQAATSEFPGVMVQFEDFGNTNAFRLLNKYRNQICAFNDDIQGTGSVTLAGLYAAMRVTNGDLKDQKILFLGAGSAGIGIADQIVSAMTAEGLSLKKARQNCWFVDSKGLVVANRDGLTENKERYAHAFDQCPDFLTSVERLKPNAIIGVSGQPGSFTGEVLQSMADHNPHPIIFALSNPTSKSECTAEEAYRWTEGRALFASGSPFKPLTFNGRRYVPGQGNNAYIFPGLGLGVICTRANRVTDDMFLIAAKTLANGVTEENLAQGCLFPPLNRVRQISLAIAVAVAELAYEKGIAAQPRPENMVSAIQSQMFEAKYKDYTAT